MKTITLYEFFEIDKKLKELEHTKKNYIYSAWAGLKRSTNHYRKILGNAVGSEFTVIANEPFTYLKIKHQRNGLKGMIYRKTGSNG